MFLVEVLAPRVLVELGVGEGTLFCAYSQAVRQLGLSTRCFAIGNWPNGHSEPDDLLSLANLRAHHDPLYGDFSQLIQVAPGEAHTNFENGAVDLLHISGRSSNELPGDWIESWLPKMSNRGVIVLDSISLHEGESHVWKLWKKLKAEHPHFEFLHERGLGVISVGASPSDQVKQLLGAREPSASLIREFFRQQGQKLKGRLEKEREIKNLFRQAQDREQEMMELSTKLEGSQKHEGVLLRLLDKSGLEVEALSTEVEARSTELASTNTQLQAILNSRAWRWVSRYGRAKMRLLAPAHKLFRSPFHNGAPAPVFQLPAPIDPFEAWLEVNRWNQRRETLLKQRLSELMQPPLLTVVLPVNDSSIEFLNKTIESVVSQTYQNWELLVADDGRNHPSLDSTLKQWMDNESRLKRITASESLNHAINDAIASARGEYVAFVGQADEVTPDALGELALCICASPQVQIVYADHDRIDREGVRGDPQFKPDWSPTLKHPQACFAPFLAIERRLALETAALPEELQGSADSDFVVRARDGNWHVTHIPKILYHQRVVSESSAARDSTLVNGAHEQRDRLDSKPEVAKEDNALPIKARTIAPRSLKPIRTLMCAFNLNLEGAPHSQYEMTVKLKEDGIISPLVYSPTDGPLRQEYERQGIKVHVRQHPLAGAIALRDYEKRIEGFAKWMKDWKIELVYGNTLQTFYAIEAAHRVNLPSVWNPRESDPWRTYFDFLPAEIANRALQCFSYPYQVIFVANATQEAWQHLNSRHNFMVIHNGLNRARFNAALREWPREAARQQLGISESELLVLLLGTVCERKGQIDLVEAVRHLSDQNAAKAKFLIVGDRASDYSERLGRALQRVPYSRRSRIEVIPETADAVRFYAAADIFVCTSRVESFPRVILEALAAGLPIITTPVFGIAEQVQQNASALFYEPGDAQALAGAIARMIEEPALRQKLAAGTTPALDALIDFDSMVNAYAEVFREAWLSGGTRAWKMESVSQAPLETQTAIA